MNSRLADFAIAGIVCAASGLMIVTLPTPGVSVEVPGNSAGNPETAPDEQQWKRTAPGKLSPDDLLRSATRHEYAPLIKSGDWAPHSNVTDAALSEDAGPQQDADNSSNPRPAAQNDSSLSGKTRINPHVPANNSARYSNNANGKTAKRSKTPPARQPRPSRYIQFNRYGTARKPAAVLPPPQDAKPLPEQSDSKTQADIQQMAHEEVVDAEVQVGPIDQLQQYQSSETLMHLQQLYNEAGRQMPTPPQVVPINPVDQGGQGPSGRNGDTNIHMSTPRQAPLSKPGLLNRLLGRRSRSSAPRNQNGAAQPMQGNPQGAGTRNSATGQPNQVFYPGNAGQMTGQQQVPANQYPQQLPQQQQLQLQLQQQQQFQQQQQQQFQQQQSAQQQSNQPRRFQEPADAAGRVRLPNIDGQKEGDDGDFFPDDLAETKKPSAKQKPQNGFDLEGDDMPLPVDPPTTEPEESQEKRAPATEHASRAGKKPISPMRLDDAKSEEAEDDDRSAADEIIIKPNGKEAVRIKPADNSGDEGKPLSESSTNDKESGESETPANENPFTGMKLLDEPATAATTGPALTPPAKDAADQTDVANKAEDKSNVVKADGIAADGKAQQAKVEKNPAPPLINLTDEALPAAAPQPQPQATADHKTPRVSPEPHLQSFGDAIDEELEAAAKMRRIYERVERPGLKGFCIVELRDHRDLIDAKPEFETVHNGITYQFSSAEALERFQRNPEGYVPINRGNDIVLSTHQNEEVKGTLEYAAWFRGRLYLFSTAETKATFVTNPAHYADTIVAHSEP